MVVSVTQLPLADAPWPAALLAILKLLYRDESIGAEPVQMPASLEYWLCTPTLSIQGLGLTEFLDL